MENSDNASGEGQVPHEFLTKKNMPEYLWQENVTMKRHMKVFIRFYIASYLLRLLASAFEPISPLVFNLLLPYLFASIVTLVGISAYTKRQLNTREEARHCTATQLAIHTRIRLASVLICVILMLDLVIIRQMESDPMILLMVYATVLFALQNAVFHFVKSVASLVVFSLVFAGFFWYDCMLHCEKPLTLLVFAVTFGFVGFHIVHRHIKMDQQVYINAWCTEHNQNIKKEFVACLSDPVMIVGKSALLYANPACVDRFGVTQDNYEEKLRLFVRPNYRSLLDTVLEGLSDNDTYSAPETEYRNDAAEDEPAFYRVCMVTSSYCSDRKTLAVIFKSVPANALPVPIQVLHYLRTAVSSLRGVLGEAKIVAKDYDTKMRIAEANAATKLLSSQIGLVADHFQLQSRGSFTLRPAKTNLRGLLRHTVNMVYLTLGKDKRGQVEILLSETENLVSEVRIDRRRVEEALLSVLHNLTSRIQQGQVELKAWHNEGAVPNDHSIEFSFVSTESPPATQTSQLRQSTLKSALSSTLTSVCCGGGFFASRAEELLYGPQSLSAAKAVCQRLGGSLSVESAAGQAVVVNVRLPYEPISTPGDTLFTELEEHKGMKPVLVPETGFRPANRTASTKELLRKNEKRSDERGVRFIVADGMELNRLVLMRLIKKCGYEAVEARDGTEAVERARDIVVNQRISVSRLVVLMDIEMPGTDGVEAMRKIRELAHVGFFASSLSVVAVTVRAEEGEARRYVDAGFDQFMPKPVGLSDIKQLLDLLKIAYN